MALVTRHSSLFDRGIFSPDPRFTHRILPLPVAMSRNSLQSSSPNGHFPPALLPTPTSPSTRASKLSPSTQPPSSSNSKTTHVCDQCSRAFSRAEHLERHLTTHMPSSASKSFICEACGKGFTRKDVLTRHIRAVHETKKSDVRKSRRKSCRRCASFKIKCSGGSRGRSDQQGGRAAEACEACKKRDVECIFDFGATVGVSNDGQKNTENSYHEDELLDFGSDDVHSEAETGSSVDYSVKRRKTTHAATTTTPSSYLPITATSAADVSPHLLSAARLASTDNTASDLLRSEANQFSAAAGAPVAELGDADNLMSLMTSKTYFMSSASASSGVPTPEKEASLPRARQHSYNFSHLYFPPIRDASTEREPNEELGSIAEEDLNAASTLQRIKPNSPTNTSATIPPPAATSTSGEDQWNGIQNEVMLKPLTMAGIMPSVTYNEMDFMDVDGGSYHKSANTTLGMDPTEPSAITSQDMNTKPTDPDPGGLTDFTNIKPEDNWFFDSGIFDNSTDWLRDWGGDSFQGTDFAFNQGPGSVVDFNLGATSLPSTVFGGEVASLSTASTRDLSSPKSTISDEGLSYTARGAGEDSNVPILPSVSPMKDTSASTDFLPWGWHTHREEHPRRVTLPPLRQILESGSDKRSRPEDKTWGTLGGVVVTETMRKEMIQVLTMPSARPLYPAIETTEIETRFPSKEVISGFIDLYFTKFHAMLPMIHQPTFCVAQCPNVLQVAMICIGASYSNFKDAKIFADSLSELCKRVLMYMAESNPEYSRSPFFLQALCLQNLYALGSGSHSLYDAADVSRSTLVGNARRSGLFSGAHSQPPSSPTSAPNSPALRAVGKQGDLAQDDLETRWRQWRQQEGLKRLAWSIFEYDSTFSTLSNRRGAITISDISTRMPCSENLWAASTAAAWNTLVASSTNPEQELCGLPFYPTLKDIIGGRNDGKLLTSWGKRICAQAMGRILWDFKELEESVCSISGACNSVFRPAKETLLRSLMRITEAAVIQPWFHDADKQHSLLARLISHYTHLHAEFPTVSLVLSLARRFTAHQQDARVKRLKSLFLSDPIGARSLAWHAAQILALVRWKPVYSPVEGMRLFVAGIVLWGFGLYFRPAPPPHSAPNALLGKQEEVVRLDYLLLSTGGSGLGGGGGAAVPEEWIKSGKGKATIGMDAGEGRMMELCTEDGAKEVLRVVVGILSSLRVWGLGGEFNRVLEELLARR